MATLEIAERKVRGKVWYVVDMRGLGKGRKFFKDKSKAEDYVLGLQSDITNYGKMAFELPHELRVKYIRCDQKLQAIGADVEMATEFFIKHNKGLQNKKLKDAFSEFILSKERSNKRPEYIRLLYTSFESFSGLITTEHCHDVQRESVESWLYKNDWKAPTRRSYFINLKTFFTFCEKRGYLRLNPCQGIEQIEIESKPPGILTVEECRKLLSRCLESDKELSAFVAIQLFAGLRPVEAEQIRWENISSDFIEVSAAKAKTRKRRLVTINPTLKKWLALKGELPVKNLWRRFYRLRYDFTVGDHGKKHWKPVVNWTHDCLRHSFCSYHLAFHKNAAQTAIEAGHSERVLFGHYRELVSPKDAKAFWNLTPNHINKSS